MDDIELITLAIAVWGAILSTVLGIYKIQENRPKLKVDLSYSILDGGVEPEKVIAVTCSNTGKRPIKVTACGVKLPKHNVLHFLSNYPNPLPQKLEDGDSCLISLDIEQFARSLISEGIQTEVKLKGYAVDATGKKYIGNEIVFDPKMYGE